MRKILLSIIMVCMCSILVVTPTFADGCPDNCVETSILGDEHGCSCDDGKGSSIIRILEEFVIPIMTAGIAILAAIGITVSGVQYLTAGGNEEQVKKSKRRIFEIVLGLAAYAVIAALLAWLLPTWK